MSVPGPDLVGAVLPAEAQAHLWQLQGLSFELHPGHSPAPPQPQVWLPLVRLWHQGPCPYWDDDMAHVQGIILVVILLSKTLCISPGARGSGGLVYDQLWSGPCSGLRSA